MIKGGPPLSGEITAAGNKNAALPILAACLLTDEEVVLTQRAADPRHRDPGRGARAARRERRLVGRQRAPPAGRRRSPTRRPTRRSRRGSAPRSCSPGRCSPASARRAMPPPGRRLHRPPPPRPAPRRVHATSAPGSSGDREIEIRAPDGGLKPCAIFMDEPSVMGTENALMAAALTPGPTTIANAACEPHVQDLARLLVKMGAQIDGIGSNVMTVHGRDKLGGAEHRDLPRPHRGRQLHGARRGDRRRAADPRRRARGPDHDPPPVPPPRPAVDDRGQRRARAARAEARGPRRPRRRDPEDRRRPLARVPGRPHLDRAGARHAGAGHDPDLREDVREPPVLRRQARRHGRSDHALRSPPGDRQRSEPASR